LLPFAIVAKPPFFRGYSGRIHQAGGGGKGTRDPDQGRRGVRNRKGQDRASGGHQHRLAVRQEDQAGRGVAKDDERAYSAQSNQTNKSRLKILQTREQHLQSLFDATRDKLDGIAKDQAKYKKLLSQLILQVRLAATDGVQGDRHGQVERRAARTGGRQAGRERLQVQGGQVDQRHCAGGPEQGLRGRRHAGRLWRQDHHQQHARRASASARRPHAPRNPTRPLWAQPEPKVSCCRGSISRTDLPC
ncbi:hypothetical protein Golomagni_07735, partial [Golovinomyces magnicellulatus]